MFINLRLCLKIPCMRRKINVVSTGLATSTTSDKCCWWKGLYFRIEKPTMVEKRTKQANLLNPKLKFSI
ncbi:hypothetical protein XENTR_v10019610 [Xenopus tropicalis]|nr:hypothetical protein XENTR_v10019610 [Xenopus tropicalis]